MLENKSQIPQLLETTVSGSRFVPMLFSTPMIIAILNGTKTETRRTINVDKTLDFMGFRNNYKKLQGHAFFGDMYNFEIKETKKPKAKVGDIIWCRETFVKKEDIYFKYADVASVWQREWKWKPSLFMPKEACRLFLEVLDVKVEKLHQIDEKSAINEGVELATFSSEYYKDYNGAGYYQKAVNSYYSLWNKINGKDSHTENPFVWVYKFRIVDAPDDFR